MATNCVRNKKKTKGERRRKQAKAKEKFAEFCAAVAEKRRERKTQQAKKCRRAKRKYQGERERKKGIVGGGEREM